MKARKQTPSAPESFSKGMAVASALVFAVLGIVLLTRSFAAPKNTASTTAVSFYLSPSSQRFAVGQTANVAIRVNTLDRSTNALQADVSYDPNYFTYVGLDNAGSPFDIEAQSEQTPGLVKIARGSVADIKGDQLVTTLKFTPKTTTRKTQMTFMNTSAVIEKGTQTNILQKLTGASYSIR